MSLAHICVSIPTGPPAPPDQDWEWATDEDGEDEGEQPIGEAPRTDLHLSRATCGGCGERLLARNVETTNGPAFVALCWVCDRQEIDGAAIAAAPWAGGEQLTDKQGEREHDVVRMAPGGSRGCGRAHCRRHSGATT